MRTYHMGGAAQLLGVSPDTVRRWADAGSLPTRRDENGYRVVDGRDLAAFAVELATRPPTKQGGKTGSRDAGEIPPHSSVRNHFPGIVTRVLRGDVMAQVEIQAGPHRVVSLLTCEAADELELAEGMEAVAAVKSTNVTVELP